MSTAETETKPQNGKAKANVSQAVAPTQSKFGVITTNPLMYKNESCKASPIQGRIISIERMPLAEDQNTKEKTKEWYVFNIELTAPSIGENNSNQVVEAKVGDVVQLPLSKNLQTVAQQFVAATESGKYLEVHIQPTEKTKLKGGRTQWEYSIGLELPQFRSDRPKGVPYKIDSSGGGVTNLFAPTVTVKALPAAGDFNTTEGDDLPF